MAIAPMAAMPVENAMVAKPPSIAVIFASSADVVGLPCRPYTKPDCRFWNTAARSRTSRPADVRNVGGRARVEAQVTMRLLAEPDARGDADARRWRVVGGEPQRPGPGEIDAVERAIDCQRGGEPSRSARELGRAIGA